jgi:peptide-methionine (S)-S-oxide reductase
MFKFRNRNPAARRPAPAPPLAGNGPAGAERATFAAGCFWGVEAAFRQIDGVRQTAAGYTGGHAEHPTYRQVCGHRTGHAEAVEVWFDPARVSYAQLLEAFWRMHNPTTRNRQGWDLGSQYRSAIFFHSPEQEALAIASRVSLLPRRGIPPALPGKARASKLRGHRPPAGRRPQRRLWPAVDEPPMMLGERPLPKACRGRSRHCAPARAG